MPQRPSHPGRHQAATRPSVRARLSAWASGLVFCGILVGGLFVVVLILALRPATATTGPAADPSWTACRRSDTAAWALIGGGVQYKDVHGSIDNGALSDPQLRRLYAAAQHAHLACRDEVARQAPTGQDGP